MKLKISFIFLNVVLALITINLYAQEAPIINEKRISPLFMGGISGNYITPSIFAMGGVRINRFAPFLKIKGQTIWGFDDKNFIGGAITGGCLFRVFKPLFVQTGIGFASFEGETHSYNHTTGWISEIKDKYQGLALEIGIVLKNRFVLVSCGVSSVLDNDALFHDDYPSIEFNYTELNLGIGIMF